MFKYYQLQAKEREPLENVESFLQENLRANTLTMLLRDEEEIPEVTVPYVAVRHNETGNIIARAAKRLFSPRYIADVLLEAEEPQMKTIEGVLLDIPSVKLLKTSGATSVNWDIKTDAQSSQEIATNYIERVQALIEKQYSSLRATFAIGAETSYSNNKTYYSFFVEGTIHGPVEQMVELRKEIGGKLASGYFLKIKREELQVSNGHKA